MNPYSKFQRNTWLAWKSDLFSEVSPERHTAAQVDYPDFIQRDETFKKLARFFSENTPELNEFLIAYDDENERTIFVLTSHRMWVTNKDGDEIVAYSLQYLS